MARKASCWARWASGDCISDWGDGEGRNWGIGGAGDGDALIERWGDGEASSRSVLGLLLACVVVACVLCY